MDSQNSVTGYGPSSLGENGFRNTPIWPGGASRSLAQDAKKAVYMTFLLDQSESMGWEANGHRRFELVNKGLRGTLLELPRQVSPRLDLRVRVIGFNNKLHNRSAGYQPIKSLADRESVFLTERDCASTTSLWGAINYAQGEYFTTEQVIDRWDNDLDGFGIVKGDTREEVIEALGLPPETIDTINRYNEMCEKGEDTDFYKSPDKLISIGEDDGPFYGAPFSPGLLTSLGGCRSDVHLRVLDANDEPIEGLYHVGCMIGDFYSATYTYAMEGMNYGACCITLPYCLGKELASGELD